MALVLNVIFCGLSAQQYIRKRASPIYLDDYCVPVSDVAGRRHLGSAAVSQLTVPRVRRSTFGSRAFAAASPTVWTLLPECSRGTSR